MAIRSADEIISAFSNIIGDRNDDDVLNFIEDVTDTINDSKTNYKEMYEAAVSENERLDTEWRNRYRERFESGVDVDDTRDDPPAMPKRYTYEELFN